MFLCIENKVDLLLQQRQYLNCKGWLLATCIIAGYVYTQSHICPLCTYLGQLDAKISTPCTLIKQLSIDYFMQVPKGLRIYLFTYIEAFNLFFITEVAKKSYFILNNVIISDYMTCSYTYIQDRYVHEYVQSLQTAGTV